MERLSERGMYARIGHAVADDELNIMRSVATGGRLS
jgi:hypothetical protein